MIERSFDEMIGYFNRRVSEMDIDIEYKMELLGMITALGYKHEKTTQRWIPCSERLPEEDVEVLVTDDAGGIIAIDVDRCGMYEDTKERFWYTSQHVIAWMPLPEPYHDGEQDE